MVSAGTVPPVSINLFVPPVFAVKVVNVQIGVGTAAVVVFKLARRGVPA